MPWDPTAVGGTAQQDNQYTPAAPAVLHASAARTATGNQATGTDVSAGEAVALEVNVTAVSGTTPSMTLAVQWSNDGTNWGSADPVDTFTAVTAATRVFKNVTVKARYLRLAWTISGTTPSFTFVVNMGLLT